MSKYDIIFSKFTIFEKLAAINPPPFPPNIDLETLAVLRELISAHRALAELKGAAKTIPNEGILISTLALQEAQDSSAVENIVTTQDALYKHRLQPEKADIASKEVARYAESLIIGFEQVQQSSSLTTNTILRIQRQLEHNQAGYRKLPGVVLRNQQTGETVFEPPSPEHIPALMSRLEAFIHDDELALDPLVKMALIHHQFETIHPFYDGNGRTGRIINILYLVKTGQLDTPILYLSRYINQTKDQYYTLLQEARTTDNWESWLLYMIRGVTLTARSTLTLIEQVTRLLQTYKHHIRRQHKFYSQNLINNIFRHPYTKVAFLENDLQISRATATRYLDALADDGILIKAKLGRVNYYINQRLVSLLFDLPAVLPEPKTTQPR